MSRDGLGKLELLQTDQEVDETVKLEQKVSRELMGKVGAWGVEEDKVRACETELLIAREKSNKARVGNRHYTK